MRKFLPISCLTKAIAKFPQESKTVAARGPELLTEISFLSWNLISTQLIPAVTVDAKGLAFLSFF